MKLPYLLTLLYLSNLFASLLEITATSGCAVSKTTGALEVSLVCDEGLSDGCSVLFSGLTVSTGAFSLDPDSIGTYTGVAGCTGCTGTGIGTGVGAGCIGSTGNTISPPSVTGTTSEGTSSLSLLSNPNPNKAAAPAPYFQPFCSIYFLQSFPLPGPTNVVRPPPIGKSGRTVVVSPPALDGTGKFGFLTTTSLGAFAKTASLTSPNSSTILPVLGCGFLNHPIESGLTTLAASAALSAALAASAPCAIAFTPLRAAFVAVAAFPTPGINPAADNPIPTQSLLSRLLPIPKISPTTGINSAVSNKPPPNLTRFLPL